MVSEYSDGAAPESTANGAPIMVRSLVPADLAAALAIQAQSYPPFLLEDEAAFASRLAVRRPYCLAAVSDGVLIAYLLAHGWAGQSPPPVGAQLAPDVSGDVLFIHDLAVSAAGQGCGLGRKLIDYAFELAARDGLRTAELIAVEGAAPYWRGLGFAEGDPSPQLAARVAHYGADARWMTRAITPDLA